MEAAMATDALVMRTAAGELRGANENGIAVFRAVVCTENFIRID